MIEPPRFSPDSTQCERTEEELPRYDELDISARKQVEVLFAGEKRLLEVIAAGGPLATTLDALCRLAEDVDRSSVVSILLVDRLGKFRCGAGPSLPPSYADALNGWPVGLGIGPCAAAAHLGEQVISLDITADERWANEYRALASAHGLRACWSTPINSSEGRVLGTFAIYPSESASPTPEQRSRIEQLTHLASIAIERTQSIDALRRSEERYARAMAAAGDGHIEWTVATDEFYASPHFLEMCGFPADTTFTNRADFLARFPFRPEDRQRIVDALNATLAVAAVRDRLELEMRILRHGETRWHRVTGLCSRDATGELLRWNAAITDITDRKLADEALRQSREGYALALEASGEGHWDWNIAKNEYHLSPRVLELCRFPPGATFKDREDFLAQIPFHPEDRARWEEAIAAHFAGKDARFDIELRLHTDGETRWMHITGILSRDASGNPVRWTGVVADITERKHAEEALRRSEAALRVSEERYALALEASEEGHFDIDLQAGEIFVSARVNEIYGFPAQAQTLNRSEFLKQIPFHPDDLPRVLAEVNKHDWNDRNLQEIQCRIVPRSGETRWIRSRAKVVRDAQGRPRRRVGVLADITERKRAEEALREQTERLQLGQAAMRMIVMDWNIKEDLLTWSDSPEWLRGPMPAIGGYPLFKDQVHPEDRDSFLATRSRALDTLQVQTTEFRLVRTDGEVIWVLERKQAFAGIDGEPVRMLAAMFDITDRKRIEEALRLSEERYDLAMGASGEGHWDWKIPSGEFYVSPRYLALLGLPPDTQFHDRSDFVRQLPFHPEDRAAYEAAVAAHFAGQTPRLDMVIRLLREGELRWLHVIGECLRDGNGKPVRWAGSVSDISDRKRAVDELRESEARFRALTALWSDWYWRQDEHLRFTYSTAAIDPPDGYPGGKAIGKRRWELPGIVPLSTSWPEHRELLAARKPFRDFEYSRPAADGTVRYVSTSGTPIFDEKGEFRGYHGVARNITERKRVEEELRSRREMLEVAQKAARAAAFEWCVGVGEGENRWSPDLEAMHGIPLGSYDGTDESWKRLVFPEDWPNVRKAIEVAQQTGDVDAEYRVVHPGGAIRWLQAKGRMFFDPENKPARIVGFMLDVTDRHLAEEELQRIERQLRQAQRLEALGTLAGGIAHDFNNLLGAILGYGEMALRNVRAGSRLRRDIENIVIAGERGHALVERILAFSRSGVGEQVAVHVEKVVRETLALFAAKLPRHIVMERRLHSGRAAVMGDPTQVHQVLMNLLTNAAQAMPSGGTLRVSLERIHLQAPRVVTTGSIAAREYVAMDVSDSGNGIPAEILERIFDPFFTTKDVGVGTGLGLSLVHGIVTGLGGAIDVETSVGKGSVFKVYLPLADDVAAPSKPRTRLRPKTAPKGQGRVMVIDDEAALMRLTTKTLMELGYSTFGFTSSAKAIAAFLADPEQFDAVITDESMPGASGSELIRKMRVLRPTMPILLVSGYLNAAVIERAREAGASEVLKKPLSARQLQIAVERVLRPTRASSAKDLASSKASTRAAKS